MLAYFVARGGTRKAAVDAMQLPGFKEELEAHGARLEHDAKGEPYVNFASRDVERACWPLIEAAVGPDAEAPADRVQHRDPLPVLGMPEATGGRTLRRESRGGRRGRRKGEVLIEECNKAGRVYFRHPDESDYRIWQRYRQGRAGERDLLSKNMVSYLCTALAEEWLPWTERGGGHLLVSRIPDEFRASKESLVIPREKPAG